jgi:N-acetyltransferase
MARYVAPTPMTVESHSLVGRRVVLAPLSLDHVPGLAAANAPGLTQWFPKPIEPTVAGMRSYVEVALTDQAAGRAVVYTVMLPDGSVAGMTRYGNIDRPNRRLEIGWTWYSSALHGTGVNVEAKLLLLDQAFGPFGAIRVEFKTDSLNERSMGALTALGATREGVLRQHVVCADGRVRDSVYYAILDTEWSAVRTRLTARLDAKHPAPESQS